MKQILKVLTKARRNKNKPLMIIANTIPGKGVDFMENDHRWHGAPPGRLKTERSPEKDEQLGVALGELHAQEAQLDQHWITWHQKYQPIHLQSKKKK